MTVYLRLLGFYAVLHLPVLGGMVGHALEYAIMHLWEYHAVAAERCILPVVWLLLFAIPAGALTGYWFVAGDAAVLLLVLFKLFGGHNG